MDPISKLQLFQPLMPPESVGAGGRAKHVQPTSSEQNPFGAYGAISRIDGEKTPTYGAQDSTYTNGLGHSKHKFMLMA